MPFCLARSAMVLPMSCAPARLPPLTFVFSGLALLPLAPLFSEAGFALFLASPLAPFFAPLGVFSGEPVFGAIPASALTEARFTVSALLVSPLALLSASALAVSGLAVSAAALFAAAPLAASALAAAPLAAASLPASVAAARKAFSLDAAATKVWPCMSSMSCA